MKANVLLILLISTSLRAELGPLLPPLNLSGGSCTGVGCTPTPAVDCSIAQVKKIFEDHAEAIKKYGDTSFDIGPFKTALAPCLSGKPKPEDFKIVARQNDVGNGYSASFEGVIVAFQKYGNNFPIVDAFIIASGATLYSGKAYFVGMQGQLTNDTEEADRDVFIWTNTGTPLSNKIIEGPRKNECEVLFQGPNGAGPFVRFWLPGQDADWAMLNLCQAQVAGIMSLDPLTTWNPSAFDVSPVVCVPPPEFF